MRVSGAMYTYDFYVEKRTKTETHNQTDGDHRSEAVLEDVVPMSGQRSQLPLLP